jgi:hypothetical protein
MLIYTHQRSKKKKNTSKKFLQAQEDHRKFLASKGVKPVKRGTKLRGSSSNLSDLSVPVKTSATSDTIPGYGFKKSVDDYKWKAGSTEKPEVIAAAEEKKKRVAPAYNKGPVMYVTDAAELNSLGRKV